MSKYIVYQTINLINSKIYIGVHRTQNPYVFDGYFGCGVSLEKHFFMNHPRTYFQKALKKYGFKNFKRITLAVFDTAEEAYTLEEQLVTKDFIKRPDTYNLALGGGRGTEYYRPVYQFDLTGKLLNVWDNNTEAAHSVGVSQPSIGRARTLKGSCAGYYWSDKPEINILEYTNHTGREVFQYDADGYLIDSYPTLTKAAHAINDTEKTLYRAISSNTRRNNCYWSFKQVDRYVPKKLSLRNVMLYIYDLQGNFVTELHSGQETYKFFRTTHYGNIKAAILNNRPYNGYQISLEKLASLPSVCEEAKNTSKIVECYNNEGQLLTTFPSIKQAVKVYGTGVVRVIRGQKSNLNGLTFKIL